MSMTDKPLAGEGLTSYRYKGPYGFIMIGAKDHQDAVKEAQRSLSSCIAVIDGLEVWRIDHYENVNNPLPIEY